MVSRASEQTDITIFTTPDSSLMQEKKDSLKSILSQDDDRRAFTDSIVFAASVPDGATQHIFTEPLNLLRSRKHKRVSFGNPNPNSSDADVAKTENKQATQSIRGDRAKVSKALYAQPSAGRQDVRLLPDAVNLSPRLPGSKRRNRLGAVRITDVAHDEDPMTPITQGETVPEPNEEPEADPWGLDDLVLPIDYEYEVHDHLQAEDDEEKEALLRYTVLAIDEQKKRAIDTEKGWKIASIGEEPQDRDFVNEVQANEVTEDKELDLHCKYREYLCLRYIDASRLYTAISMRNSNSQRLKFSMTTFKGMSGHVSHLNLLDSFSSLNIYDLKERIQYDPMRPEACGGYSDIFWGYYNEEAYNLFEATKLAVKRFRMHAQGKHDFIKVCETRIKRVNNSHPSVMGTDFFQGATNNDKARPSKYTASRRLFIRWQLSMPCFNLDGEWNSS